MISWRSPKTHYTRIFWTRLTMPLVSRHLSPMMLPRVIRGNLIFNRNSTFNTWGTQASESRLLEIVFRKIAIHPWSLTWNLKIMVWFQKKSPFHGLIFRFHVKLQGCTRINHSTLNTKCTCDSNCMVASYQFFPTGIFKYWKVLPSWERSPIPHQWALLSRWFAFFPRWDTLVPCRVIILTDLVRYLKWSTYKSCMDKAYIRENPAPK